MEHQRWPPILEEEGDPLEDLCGPVEIVFPGFAPSGGYGVDDIHGMDLEPVDDINFENNESGISQCLIESDYLAVTSPCRNDGEINLRQYGIRLRVWRTRTKLFEVVKVRRQDWAMGQHDLIGQDCDSLLRGAQHGGGIL